MIVEIIRHFIRFLLLVLLQVVLLNHIQWSGYVNPYVYILSIILLPTDFPKGLLLLSGFTVGITIDMFSDTGGLHAASAVALAFARPGLLKMISPRDGYDLEVPLTPQAMGVKWFITYLMLATVLHHLVLFYLEVFRFDEFFITLFKIVVNTVVSASLMLLLQYLFGRAAKSNERVIG